MQSFSPAGPPDRRFADVPLLLFVSALLFRASQNAALTTLAPLGEADLHLSTAEVGALSALSSAVTVAVTVILGRKVAAARIRPAMGVGLVVTAAALMVIGLSESDWVFVGGFVALGAGDGLVLPSVITLVGTTSRSSPSRMLAALTVVLSVGLAAGPLLESLLIRLGGGSLRLPLLVFSTFPLLAGVVVLSRGNAPSQVPAPAPLSAAASASAAMHDAVEAPLGSLPRGAAGSGTAGSDSPLAASVWQRPGWRLATSGQLLYQLPFAAIVVFGVVIARHVYGMSTAAAQLGLTAFFSASMATRLLLTWRGRLVRPRRVLLGAAGLTIVGVAVLAGAGAAPLYFVALALLGVPHGLTYPIGLGLIAEETPASLLTHANASFSAWTSAAGMALPAILGLLGDWLGLRTMLFLIIPPVAAMTAVIATTGRSTRHRTGARPTSR